jgi:hypothetical protein
VRVPGGPETLEFRLERIKRRGNLRLDFLKRLYDPRSIAELYLKGHVDVHVHVLTRPGVICARYRAGLAEKFSGIGSEGRSEGESTGIVSETTVLVGIGEGGESASPITSTIRLQILDRCHMRGIETLQPSTIYAPPEALWLIFDRELCPLYDPTGIEEGEFKNEIIESSPKIVTNLSGQKTEIEGYNLFLDKNDLDAVRSIRVEIPNGGITLRLPDGFNSFYKLTKVFACPVNTGEGTC